MCGRMDINEHGPTAKALARWFEALAIRLEPNNNVCPTEWVPVLRTEQGERAVRLLRWGLIPSWTKDPSIGSKLFNARSETAHEKPAFREAMKRRRCVILCDAFYDWTGPKGKRQKLRISMADDAPVLLAGLWDAWRSPEGVIVESCTVLTCEPNALLAAVHTRMPVILEESALDRWLDPAMTDAAKLQDLLRPHDADVMRMEAA
jgi:putative SOS response-associated peptidase YedK